MLAERALGVAERPRVVTPEVEGLVPGAPFVRGVLGGRRLVLGTLRWSREWERPLLAGRAESVEPW